MKKRQELSLFFIATMVGVAIAIPKSPLPIKQYTITKMQINPRIDTDPGDDPPFGATEINCASS